LGLGFLKLLGFEHEAGGLLEVNPAQAGGAVGVVLRYGVLERVIGIRLWLGAGHVEHVTEFGDEWLAACRPARDKSLKFPARHGVVLHQWRSNSNCQL
jgi:hypothetical protein